MRVHTSRFEKLRSCESRKAQSIKVVDREYTVQPSFAVSPPVPRASRHKCGQLMGSPETAEATIDSHSRAPVLKLDSPEPVTYPRVQTFEFLRGLCQPEVGPPTSEVCPHLFGNLGHALASNASGDDPDTLLERVECLRSHGNFDGVS